MIEDVLLSHCTLGRFFREYAAILWQMLTLLWIFHTFHPMHPPHLRSAMSEHYWQIMLDIVVATGVADTATAMGKEAFFHK